MNTAVRSDKQHRAVQTAGTGQRSFRLAPVAQAIALIVATGALVGNVHAAQPFSAGWYAAKGAMQETARTTGMVNGKPVALINNPGLQQQQANAQLQQSIANLSMAARGIAMQQMAQAQQRAALMNNAGTVPDGLGVNGLDTGSLAASWINANAPTQTTDANGKIVVGINQTADKAIANWESFNVGKNTIVQFNQASSDWAILNRIADPLAPPSQIQGQIRAPGTVLIVNKNGIVFTGTSQVNTRNLVAAAANISDDQFKAGGLYSTQAGGNYLPSFTDANGNLTVEQGAQITTSAPASVTQGGGYVLLMGKNVSNGGDIETPKGQIQLAAGDNFVIRKGVGTDANQASTTRGNEISPQFVTNSTAGQVVNTETGLLLSREGDITLAGHDVQQNGVVVATTNVNTRGTIHLLNSASDTTGSVTLGGKAITTIVLDDDGATALDSQRDAMIAASAKQDVARPGTSVGQFDNLSRQTDREDQGRIEIVSGGDVNFEGGSLTLATGGQIAVTAAHRAFAATGSILDVAGAVGVNLAMASNNVVVNVQGNELRDSPDNRDSGSLFNNNITVDRRDLILVPASAAYPTDRWYTAGGLLEVSGYLNNQTHGIGEWAAQGGTIQLGGKEVIAQTGSQVNLSGGTLNVATGYVAQTWLVGSDGNLYNANNAPAGMTFHGVYKGFEVSHTRWGADATEFFYNPLIAPKQRLESGYTVGRDAGQLIVDAPTAVMEGNVVATVYTGPQQVRVRDAVDGYGQAQTAVARAGTLSFGQYGAGGLSGANATDLDIDNIADITGNMTIGDALAADRIGTTWLDANHLNAQGLGGLDLASSSVVSIDAPLTLADGGSLTVTSPQITIDADVTVHSGSIVLGNIIHIPKIDIQLEQWNTLAGAAGTTPQISIGAHSTLDLTGVRTNALNDPDNLTGLAYLNGGSLTAVTSGGIALAAGSVVDVSSGGAILPTGKNKGGKGGDVSLITNDYSHLSLPDFYLTDRTAPLVMDGELRAYGFTGGGTLTLNGPQQLLIGDGTVAPGQSHLDIGLFSSGFTHYDITAADGIAIADGTQLAPTVPVYQFTGSGVDADGNLTLALWQPPVSLADPVSRTITRRVGADLTLVTTRGDFTLPSGAAMAVDPGHDVNIYAYGQTTIEGDITARGGNIVIAGANERGVLPNQIRVLGGTGGFSLTRSIWIGDDTMLDVSGYADTAVDTRGGHFGTVSDGGSIQLGGVGNDASDAFVIIRPGAVLNASGAAGVIDVQNGAVATPTRVATDGGLIALSSNSGIYIDGSLRAAAGGEGASGGTLSMNMVSGVYQPRPDSADAPGGIGTIPEALRKLRNITITQQHEDTGLTGLAPGQADPALLFGSAAISADQVHDGGFASLALTASDLFVFKGDVSLSLARSLSLSSGIFSVTDATPDIHVALSAPYININGGGPRVIQGVTTYSPGLAGAGSTDKTNSSSFQVTADLLDVSGDVRFGVKGQQGSGSIRYVSDIDNTPGGGAGVDAAGFRQVSLTSNGDIRIGNGAFKTTGNLDLTAAQIYPLSAAAMIIDAGMVASNSVGQSGDVFDQNRPGTITIRGVGETPAMPASAFGDLSFIAATIDQGGVVRAPLGSVNFNSGPRGSAVFTITPSTSTVILRAGSVTSVSAQGLVMPFGGTTDGISYQGADGTLINLAAQVPGGGDTSPPGIMVAATSVVGEAGALLDVSGGGTLTGAGFIAGRGGSVDTLKYPLVSSNPANTFSAAGNHVYAILPGYAAAYAPVIATNGAGDPAIGQQMTVPSGVPGLAAGTYTLLPSSYALMPGAFRVEVGATSAVATVPTRLPDGAYLTTGLAGVAGTGIRDTLPTQLIISSGKQVRSTSQYNETSYADFARKQAAVFGGVRPRLPDDGSILQFGIGASDGVTPALSFAGTVNFDPVNDGIAGSLLITSTAPSNTIDIVAPGTAPVIGHSVVSSADLNAFHAAALFIGNGYAYVNDPNTGPRLALIGNGQINLMNGATLRAGQVFLVGSRIDVAAGAVIDTRGQATTGLDSSLGYVFGNSRNDVGTTTAILAVANGWLNILPVVGSGTMNIASGASLLTEGSIVLGAPGSLTIGDVNFGARYLTVAQNQINVGDTAALAQAQAAGVLQPGWTLNQAALDRLLRPSSTAGVPALERLSLTVGGAISVFGSVALDARSQSSGDVELVLNTPAIYGLGTASDTAVISADQLVWNGIRTSSSDPATGRPVYASQAPAAVVAGGAGTGTGSLTVQARDITFGYDKDSRTTDGATLDRVAIGFANVNLIAGERISSNSDGTLTVAQSKDSSGVLSGGNLSMTTPLLTAQQGAAIAFQAGGAVHVTSASAVAATTDVTDYGGTVSLTGDSVLLDTAVALPSGKLTISATNDVTLGANAQVDLAGRKLIFFDQTQYSWGGDLILSSAQGDIRQLAGSLIDVSAQKNAAGSVTASATHAGHGHVAFDGSLSAATGDGQPSGRFNVAAQDFGDFAGLNALLNTAGFYGGRTFVLKQGDLVVGDEVKAQSVSISVDAGNLTVNGVIDASGLAPGSIRLAATGWLTLASSAVLDAHGTRLQTDSYGAPIEASNTAHIDLSSSAGTVTLAPGLTIDMQAADGIARGKLEINAPRLGMGGSATGADAPLNATGNNIDISAAGPITIRGAASIAVNGFATYTNAPADPDDSNGQVIDQAWLDKIHQDSTDFINAAGNNPDLQGRLAGLMSYGPAFHLRPGVEIASATPDGNLSTKGDLDLSNYRYGPGADTTGHTGAGEVGVITLRAGGNLKINGSINDGFALPPVSPDALTTLFSGDLSSAYTVTTAGSSLSAGATLPADTLISIPLSLPDDTYMTTTPDASTPLPVDVTLSQDYTSVVDSGITGKILDANGNVLFQTGDTIPGNTFLPAGSKIARGSYFDNPQMFFVFWGLFIKAVTIPANTQHVVFGDYVFGANTPLAAGTVLPAGMSSVNITGPGDRQFWVTSPMQQPGSQSWSMRFVAGADLAAADSRALQTPLQLGNKGNVVLNDPFTVGVAGSIDPTQGISVVRTGTGSLEILAGGNYQQQSPFGVYTAGTAIAQTGTSANAPYNIDRATQSDGSVLGAINADYNVTLNAQRMYYTEHGGDFLLVAQGDIGGNLKANDSNLIGNWLWRQGGNGQATAWGINFGSYVAETNALGSVIALDAFSGVGSLGGGNVTLTAGRDIGNAGQGIVAAVGGSGRVLADGSLAQTGGGTLSVNAGRNIGGGGNQFVDIRGNTMITGGAFGTLVSTQFGDNGGNDPRPTDTLKPYAMLNQPGGAFAIGDGTIRIQTRGDLAMGTVDDPGRVGLGQQTATDVAGTQQVSWFTLWRPTTAVELMAAGGDVTPLAAQGTGVSTGFLPPILQVSAASGSIYLEPVGGPTVPTMLMPSVYGRLDLFARDDVIQQSGSGNAAIGALATSSSSIATPQRPAWLESAFNTINGSWSIGASDIWTTPSAMPDFLTAYLYDKMGFFAGNPHQGVGGVLFAFGQNTVTDDSVMKQALTSHIYAVNGDVTSVSYGNLGTTFPAGIAVTSYSAAKTVEIIAGGDIVNPRGLILQNDPADISMLAAGGSVVYAGLGGLNIAGPGTLEVTAAGNIYQGSRASIESIGPLVTGDNRPGASVVLQAGVGAGVPGVGQVDWTGFAHRYLDPANLAASGPLADQPGKVAKTYRGELVDWLTTRFGYTPSAGDALAYFLALPAAQQRVFLRTVYYAELTAGGREYNDANGPRFASYLRGRDAIATLFPQDGAYTGDITMFSTATGTVGTSTYVIKSGSVHTDFGGDIQFLAPGGGITIGTEGLAPGADAGLITQGEGNIQLYSKNSILLGLSRIMTTFGGDILAWSAEGDINAGRGSKTTVVFTPPKLSYDDIGDVALAPQVPSTGAGIATLQPIPEVTAGDIDLIAPLGTIDAGEAGIRVSGNVNLAALQVVNAANIQVQGKSTGLPLVASVNVNALTNASAAATQASMAAQDVVRQQQSVARQALPSIFTVRVLGFGNDPAVDSGKGSPSPTATGLQSSRDVPYDPANPVQFVGVDHDYDAAKLARLSSEQRRLLQQQR